MSTCHVKYTNFQVLVYDGDCGVFPVVAKKCELIKYNGNYHVSLVDNATGDPTLVSNTDFSEAMTAGEALAFIACNCTDCPPSDLHITDFKINGDKITITMSDGTVFTQTVTHPGGAVSFEQGLEDKTGKLTSTVGGTTKVVNVTDPSLFPSGAIHAYDKADSLLGTGNIEPVPLTSTGFEQSSGGVVVSGTGITIPKSGRWHVHLRVLAQLKNVNNNLAGNENVKTQLVGPDGLVIGIKYEQADFIAGIPQAQDKREINQKHITKYLKAGEYHFKIINPTAKVNINSLQSDFHFVSNETDEN